jgi:uncharacterized RDD family membrane protein YckC
VTTPSPDSAQVRPPTPSPGWQSPGPAGPPPGHGQSYGHGPQAAFPSGYPAVPPQGYPGPWPHGHPPRPVSPGGQPLASFGDRLLAYLVDSAIVLAATLVLVVPIILVFVFAVLAPSADAGADDSPLTFMLWALGMQAGIVAISLAMGYVYHVEMMLRRGGQTIGKQVMKLRTIPIDPTAVLTRQVVARRFVAQFVGGAFIPAFSYVDGLWQLWDKPYQQCLHDKFADTVVVKVTGQ